MIAGQHPSPRSFNPDIPDGVMAIVRTALQRDPARRYASAGEMGAACEHYLYDKGYGPTNLTLKQYVSALFPEAAPLTAADADDEFPAVEPTLLPISDPPRAETRARGCRPHARRPAATSTPSPCRGRRPPMPALRRRRPAPCRPGSRPRRIKTRIRPR